MPADRLTPAETRRGAGRRTVSLDRLAVLLDELCEELIDPRVGDDRQLEAFNNGVECLADDLRARLGLTESR